MTIRLRAHHLLCMLTYVGKGYSPGFVANYDRIVVRLSSGEDIVIVEGPDDVCAPLLTEKAPHCRKTSIVERDEKAAKAIAELLGHKVEFGARIVPDATLLARLRQAFKAQTIRNGCDGCEWAGFCTRIADGGFEGVTLKASGSHEIT